MTRMSSNHVCVMLLVALVAMAILPGCHSGTDGSSSARQAALSGVDAAQSCLLGDLDGDGSPDIDDAVSIFRIVVGLSPEDPLADCDGDGTTGVSDGMMVMRSVVDLDEWPIAGRATMVGPDGQTFVWVAGGTFVMGSDTGMDCERPAHTVTLDGFWIGMYEVTNDQYAAFLTQAWWPGVLEWCQVGAPESHIIDEGGFVARDGWNHHPIIDVTWDGAAAYCEYYGYSLPTEAQWEYAAAGPTSRRFPWGDEWSRSYCLSFSPGHGALTAYPVGGVPAGASWCGALDMAGNVWEWCADYYDHDYYGQSPALNPAGPGQTEFRVLRGGSWACDDPDNFRCAFRNYNEPDGYNTQLGFRCVMAP